MARITSVEKRGPASWAFGFPGGKVAGTTDQELGERLVAAFDADPEHCLVELSLEKRGERLHITEASYIEAPEELGGPTETPTGAAATADDPPERADLPSPMTTLDDLLKLEERVSHIEERLELEFEGWERKR